MRRASLVAKFVGLSGFLLDHGYDAGEDNDVATFCRVVFNPALAGDVAVLGLFAVIMNASVTILIPLHQI